MLVCPQDGRHLRAFVGDENFVRQVLARLEGHTPSLESGADADGNPTPTDSSKTKLEGGNG
jgi:hypothetical protein